MNLKLNTLLAKTDHLSTIFKGMITDYVKFFKSSQGAFKGERKSYEPKPGTMDVPSERSNKLVVTTVAEKLDFLERTSADYINALFAQEATNAKGIVRAKLEVDGELFGEFSSLELLRLKSLLENGTLKELYENIPVRNDDEIWAPTTNEMYSSRAVYETPLRTGTTKTTVKEQYILPDPNIGKIENASTKYTPMVATKDNTLELGDYSHQRFSGEYTHTQRAEILARRSRLLTAVIEALKVANDVVAVESEMTANKIFSYLHRGKI